MHDVNSELLRVDFFFFCLYMRVVLLCFFLPSVLSYSLIGRAMQSRSARVVTTNEMGRKSGHLIMCINKIPL